ncbi:hypothetical protein AOQ84DRAFT_380245 [Glonium stellatum]|uniref:Uncharacterized protein n=1 Tax=Glonium stellatum TaxID=574774 RepID=A0A8E2ETU6_9PEZI|nr:hypothetical protein AOQ84DRAFT_380245 [Glonium stellatum]
MAQKAVARDEVQKGKGHEWVFGTPGAGQHSLTRRLSGFLSGSLWLPCSLARSPAACGGRSATAPPTFWVWLSGTGFVFLDLSSTSRTQACFLRAKPAHQLFRSTFD